MMKIAVVGANGREGSLITKNLLNAGQDVTAVVRTKNNTKAPKALIKDALALTRQDLAGFDVVVDALGGWTAQTVNIIPDGEKHLANLLEGTNTRLVVVGGAGSLYTDPEHTETVADGKDFPDIFKPVTSAHDKALADLRTRKNLRWTYISPAADFQADGPETGHVIVAGEDFTLNKEGKSEISYADYAQAFVREVLEGKHIGQRISFLQG